MQNFKTLLVLALVCVGIVIGLIGLMQWKSEDKIMANSLTGTFLTADHSSFVFGEISMANGVVQHIFPLKNSETGDSLIGKIYTSCMCTTASLIVDGQEKGPFGMPGHGPVPKINQTVKSGETAELKIEFDPAAHGPAGVGKITREIYLEIPGKGKQTFSFTAMVTP